MNNNITEEELNKIIRKAIREEMRGKQTRNYEQEMIDLLTSKTLSRQEIRNTLKVSENTLTLIIRNLTRENKITRELRNKVAYFSLTREKNE